MKYLTNILVASNDITKWFILWSIVFSLGVYAIVGKDIIVNPLPKNVGYILVAYGIFVFFQPIYKWWKGRNVK